MGMVEAADAHLAVSVVIPCHGGVADTRACIASLLAQIGAPPLSIVIVDNGSSDGTAGLDAEFPGVRVVRELRNLGFAGGVNRGLAVVTTPLVLVLNNDTLAAAHLVARLVRALTSDHRIALVAPVSNHVKGPARLAVGDRGASAEGRAELEALLDDAAAGKLEDVDTLSGLCLLFRRTLLEQVPGFDERFGLGNFEDDDFCLRTRLLGHRLVIARDAFLHHHGHRTFQALGIDYQVAMRERLRTFAAKWEHDAAGTVVVARFTNDWATAEAGARRALVEHASWPDAHFVLGKTLAARGASDEATTHLRRFLATCPNHGEATVLLALQRLAHGAEAEGLALLQRAFTTLWLADDLAGFALARLARWCLDHGRGADAIAHASDAVALRPDDGDVHNLLGVTLLAGGELALAEAEFRSALDHDSRDARKNLGIALWRQGKVGPALQAMVEAVRANPEDAEARANLATAYGAVTAAAPASA